MTRRPFLPLCGYLLLTTAALLAGPACATHADEAAPHPLIPLPAQIAAVAGTVVPGMKRQEVEAPQGEQA